MDLMEISAKREMGREDVAKLLHRLADSLARHNAIDVIEQGVKVSIKVPDVVSLELEVDIESDESSLEIEISW